MQIPVRKPSHKKIVKIGSCVVANSLEKQFFLVNLVYSLLAAVIRVGVSHSNHVLLEQKGLERGLLYSCGM